MRGLFAMIVAALVAATATGYAFWRDRGGEAPARAAAADVAVLQAVVERQAGDVYRVRWQGGGADPVDIFVAMRPNAPRSEWRRLAEKDRRGIADVRMAGAARPYFYLQPASGKGLWVAERALPLEGGRNFRDLGGYRTEDGRSVRWGKVYRAGSMARLTANDYAYLDRLGIRSVCDFRTREERDAEPNRWAKAMRIDYWARDYEMSGANLQALFDGKATVAQVKAKMAENYRLLPYEQAPAYRVMFRHLVDGQVPLAFNCSAGKDRTGLAAALVLTALGVPHETVLADYTLTDRYLSEAQARDPAFAAAMKAMPAPVAEALLAADPAYLSAAFDEMNRRNGSVRAYLRQELGLSASDEARLKAALLE